MSSGIRYLTPKAKPVIHRDSSTDSRTSSDSRDSADSRYFTTSTSRGDMSESAYREGRVEMKRVPDHDSHYITITNSQSGRNKVIDHRARHYDPQEPRASDARHEDYKPTNYPRSQYSSSGSSNGTW